MSSALLKVRSVTKIETAMASCATAVRKEDQNYRKGLSAYIHFFLLAIIPTLHYTIGRFSEEVLL